MLDPSPRATSRTPQPSQAVPKRPPEAPRVPGGYPYVIRRLSVLIGMGHHTFYPPWNRELPEPSFKKSLLLDWRSVIFTKMTS